MPDMKGRFTAKEKVFVKHMAKTADATYAASVAGYAQPQRDGWRLMQNPLVQEANRAAGQALLREKGGAIGVGVLIELALDTKQPGAVRRGAATDLVKLSGMAVQENEDTKEDHELDGAGLARRAAKLRAQAAAIEHAVEVQARTIEGETVDSSPVTPSPFD